jgi:hypothetical protein
MQGVKRPKSEYETPTAHTLPLLHNRETITGDVRGPSDAYSANGFSATIGAVRSSRYCCPDTPRARCTFDTRVDNAFLFLPYVATIAEVVAFMRDVA